MTQFELMLIVMKIITIKRAVLKLKQLSGYLDIHVF